MASILNITANMNMRVLHAETYHADDIGTGAIAYAMRWAT